MLIFLYELISWDISVTSSMLKLLMKFWGFCFKLWLRPCVWSLCFDKCITQMKDGPSFIKVWKSVYNFLYYIHILEARYWLSLLQILVLGYSEFLIPFFLVSYMPSIADFLCFLSFICGHTHLLSVLGDSEFFLSLLIDASGTENICKSPKSWHFR